MTTKESQKTKKTRKADREVGGGGGGGGGEAGYVTLCHPAEDIFSWHVIHFLGCSPNINAKTTEVFFLTKVNYLYGKFSDNHTF